MNLSMMRYGSTVPDRVFNDKVKHHYPPAYDLALEWLAKAKDSWSKGEYDNASYEFGVASHYITDMYALPHGVSKEKGSDHSRYESKALLLPTFSCRKGVTLEEMIEKRANPERWELWLSEEKESIVKEDVKLAVEAVSVSLDEYLDIGCKAKETEISRKAKGLKLNTNAKVLVTILALFWALKII